MYNIFKIGGGTMTNSEQVALENFLLDMRDLIYSTLVDKLENEADAGNINYDKSGSSKTFIRFVGFIFFHLFGFDLIFNINFLFIDY